jgi:hypothetical protein
MEKNAVPAPLPLTDSYYERLLKKRKEKVESAVPTCPDVEVGKAPKPRKKKKKQTPTIAPSQGNVLVLNIFP